MGTSTKVDLKSMSPEEQRLYRMYGKIPSKSDMLNGKLRDRKYFDSGDYALSKAGHQSSVVGSKHPNPESIPRGGASPPGGRFKR